MPELTERLKAVYELVSLGAAVADIGTDHAYLPVELVKTGRVKKAIACDINQKPLLNAEKTVKSEGLLDKISLRLSDGLQMVEENEVDTVIIAGMGGEVISGIIGRAAWLKNGKHLILQPMTCPELLREYLVLNGYRIESETPVIDSGRVYTVISAFFGNNNDDKSFAYFVTGKISAKTDAGRKYLEKQLKRFSDLRRDLENIEGKEKEKSDAAAAILRINQLLEEH